MCGRFTLTKPGDLPKRFASVATFPLFPARFNVAPTQAIPAVSNAHPDRVGLFHWGLIPSWAKDKAIGNRMINARAETLAQKPSFRTAWKRRRCLIPADGFYEWRQEADGKTRTPMYIRMKDGSPFAFAGLWEVWHGPDATPLLSCTIITTSPNVLMEKIHDRMPAIVPAVDDALWLDPEEQDPAKLERVLQPYPADQMIAGPVSRMVNSPRNDSPACVEAADAEGLW